MSDIDDIRAVWQRLTGPSSYTGDAINQMKLVSWDQLVQIMHDLAPAQLVNGKGVNPSTYSASIRCAAQYYDLSDADILGQSRRSTISLARKMACMLMRDIGSMSYDSIGHALDRDHTTILYLVKSAQDLINVSSTHKVAYMAMRKALDHYIKKQNGYTEEEEEEEDQQTPSGNS